MRMEKIFLLVRFGRRLSPPFKKRLGAKRFVLFIMVFKKTISTIYRYIDVYKIKYR